MLSSDIDQSNGNAMASMGAQGPTQGWTSFSQANVQGVVDDQESLLPKEDDSYKLFVGQIPKDMDEDSLKPFFERFGPIYELTVIRDKTTKAHRGCAFVTYCQRQSADEAVTALHDKIKLGTATNFLQVRAAESQSERENKLFIGMLPKTMTEAHLQEMFEDFGELREIHIIRSPEGLSKGCAFVKFMTRDAAMQAIHSLHDTIPEGSTRPLVVKFADNKKQARKSPMIMSQGAPPAPTGHTRSGSQGANNEFWLSPGSYPYPMQGGSPMAHSVMPVPTYLSYSGAPQMPPGFVYYPQSPFFPPYAQTSGQYPVPGSPHARGPPAATTSPGAAHPPPPAPPVDSPDRSGAQNTRPLEGPSGANLFIYHLPQGLTDADLATLFSNFGNVISAKVFVDKQTSESKGFGFVSYDAVTAAETAIQVMNGFQIGNKRLKVQHKKEKHTMGGLGAADTMLSMMQNESFMAAALHPSDVMDSPDMASLSSQLGGLRLEQI